MSQRARVESGELLRRLQLGEVLGMPRSRPMPSIGRRCHELRVSDGSISWRIIYRSDPDAVIILEVFPKKSAATPSATVAARKDRLRRYDAGARRAE